MWIKKRLGRNLKIILTRVGALPRAWGMGYRDDRPFWVDRGFLEDPSKWAKSASVLLF